MGSPHHRDVQASLSAHATAFVHRVPPARKVISWAGSSPSSLLAAPLHPLGDSSLHRSACHSPRLRAPLWRYQDAETDVHCDRSKVETATPGTATHHFHRAPQPTVTVKRCKTSAVTACAPASRIGGIGDDLNASDGASAGCRALPPPRKRSKDAAVTVTGLAASPVSSMRAMCLAPPPVTANGAVLLEESGWADASDTHFPFPIGEGESRRDTIQFPQSLQPHSHLGNTLPLAVRHPEPDRVRAPAGKQRRGSCSTNGMICVGKPATVCPFS